MKLQNIIKKFQVLKFSIGLIAIGLLFTAFSVFILIKPDGNYQKTDAIIKSIEQIDEDSYRVIIDYDVYGQTLTNEIGAYSSEWKVGDKIECEFNTDDPSEVREDSGKIFALVFCVVGIAAIVFGASQLVKGIKTKTDNFDEHNRVDLTKADPALIKQISESTEAFSDYVFHYTGKMNQSYIMKTASGTPVFEGNCEGIQLIKDTSYIFKNIGTGEQYEKKIGHTVTKSIGESNFIFRTPITSGFNIDGKYVWDVLSENGYGFEFKLRGLVCCFEVKHWGTVIGQIETAGTEVMDSKYENNPLGKIPTNGIYRIKCRPSEIENIFLLCFTMSKIELFA